MTKLYCVALILGAQCLLSSGAVVKVQTDVQSSFRVQSNSSQFSLWNNAFANRIQHEIEIKAEPVKVNKMYWVIFAMLFGVCGCDRCFMGQILLGCVKGFTFGGLLIWHIIDYFVCLVSAFQKAEKIDAFGYHHIFEKSSIEGAFQLALVFLIIQIIQNCANLNNARQQAAIQQQQQEQLLKMMVAANAAQSGPQKNEEASLDVPRRHQSLAYIPTRLTAGLRKAGMVTEHPTIPELIALFDQLDKDGDGQLDRDEIQQGLSAMGVTEENVDEMIKSADTDGDGKISKNEWLINMTKKEEAK